MYQNQFENIEQNKTILNLSELLLLFMFILSYLEFVILV